MQVGLFYYVSSVVLLAYFLLLNFVLVIIGDAMVKAKLIATSSPKFFQEWLQLVRFAHRRVAGNWPGVNGLMCVLEHGPEGRDAKSCRRPLNRRQRASLVGVGFDAHRRNSVTFGLTRRASMRGQTAATPRRESMTRQDSLTMGVSQLCEIIQTRLKVAATFTDFQQSLRTKGSVLQRYVPGFREWHRFLARTRVSDTRLISTSFRTAEVDAERYAMAIEERVRSEARFWTNEADALSRVHLGRSRSSDVLEDDIQRVNNSMTPIGHGTHTAGCTMTPTVADVGRKEQVKMVAERLIDNVVIYQKLIVERTRRMHGLLEQSVQRLQDERGRLAYTKALVLSPSGPQF